MQKEDQQALDHGERIRRSHGPRKHFRGKMVNASGGPRAHTHGGNSRSRVGWSCGDQAMRSAETWKLTPGKYKVTLDARLTRKGGAFENERETA